jgi:dienelactone hydrolase
MNYRVSIPTLVSTALFALCLTSCESTVTNETPGPTPEPEIRGQEIDYNVGETTFKGYVAYDANKNGKRPGVLVVHEWWGHNEYARMRARMLAGLGYTALAVDMYGEGKTADHPADAQKFMAEAIGNLDVAKIRFEAAKKLLQAQPTVNSDQISAIGYCFGGAVVLGMARAGLDLDGVASFHGSLGTKAPAQKDKVRAKLLVMTGADDSMIPKSQVDAFVKEMKAADVDLTLHVYPGAKHAFTNPMATLLGKKLDIAIEYDGKADQDSWSALTRFLKAIYPN